MAVYAGVCSVIFRNATADARLAGGVHSFGRSRPCPMLCTDGTICRVGFMVEADAKRFIVQLIADGLAPSAEEAWTEIALLVEGFGFRNPCDWLQTGLFDGRPAAWLAGADRGDLYLPHQSLVDQPSGMRAVNLSDYRKSWDWTVLKNRGRVDAYRHKVTGERRYVARPFRAHQPWWQFWKRQQPQVDTSNGKQVYDTACNLIEPYCGYKLHEPLLPDAARKQLQSAISMIERFLEVYPVNWNALWWMGTAHRGLRELEPAYTDFRRAYALEKTRAGHEFAYMCLALGKGDEAVQVYREMMERTPADARLIADYALALFVADRLSEAESAIQDSLKLEPENKMSQNLATGIAAASAGQIPRPFRVRITPVDR
jgi:tetratricopeptide (TPR) repeat protein